MMGQYNAVGANLFDDDELSRLAFENEREKEVSQSKSRWEKVKTSLTVKNRL